MENPGGEVSLHDCLDDCTDQTIWIFASHFAGGVANWTGWHRPFISDPLS
jgi:hypothetical protein